MEYREIIFLIPYIIIFLIRVVHIILQYYTTYSKKYKNLKILEKVSEIAKKNKTIYIIDYIEEGFPYLVIIAIFFILFIYSFTNINIFCWDTDITSWIIIIAFNIWMLSILITNVYHILVYIKIMKAEKS